MARQISSIRSRISSIRKKAKLLKQCSDLVNDIQATSKDPRRLLKGKRNGSKKRRMARARRG